MELNSQQIRALRAEAHRLKLKPVVMIGQNGLSENVQNEIEQALSHHELIKVRLSAMDKAEKKSTIELICQQHAAVLIQSIGHIVVLFRTNPGKETICQTDQKLTVIRNGHRQFRIP